MRRGLPGLTQQEVRCGRARHPRSARRLVEKGTPCRRQPALLCVDDASKNVYVKRSQRQDLTIAGCSKTTAQKQRSNVTRPTGRCAQGSFSGRRGRNEIIGAHAQRDHQPGQQADAVRMRSRRPSR